MKKETKALIFRLLISLALFGILALLLYFLFKHLGLTSLTREELQGYIEASGVWGPLAFILITFLQVTIIPIPSTVTILAGSYAFGPWLSLLYSYIGLILGSALAFFLGRKLGRPYLNWVAGSPKKVDLWLQRLHGKEVVLLFFAFLLPFFPDDLLCSVAGVLPISFFTFMLMQLTTRLTSVGATLLFMSGEVIPYTGWGILVILGLFVLLGVSFLVAWKNSDKINSLLDRLAAWLKKK
ncbi:MAG: TVP38/TMEM64 family protein [Clostridia bacterium]|nr:TVP38/TMEM64 family protein [Clostridia bacterium]